MSFDFRPDFVVGMFMQAFDGSSVPTLEEIQMHVSAMLDGPLAPLRPNLDEIVREILRRIDVRIGGASILEYSVDHEPWLETAVRDEWSLWPRLLGYLRDQERLPPAVLAEVHRSTDLTLSRLESPFRQGRWDRRGLVLGHVQSGKTTHYTALAAKAIDAGYRIVIILAGIHNSLRSQTHERIDRHLIGRDSTALSPGGESMLRLKGVGEYARDLALPSTAFSILTCTTAAEAGDFRSNMARQVWLEVNQGARLVMVVKKNATILTKLRDWLRTLLAGQNPQGSPGLITEPTLVIDDEADQASINTKDPDQDPPAINGLIRELLMSFTRVGFVGYTATPFANIFIDPTVAFDATKFGHDLFPRSFIISLKAPSDYIGQSVVFGHPGDESVGISPQQPLPMYVEVRDSLAWIPVPHDKNHVPGPLPASLKEAMRLFILVCATRATRGDDRAHNSMLVHATRFVAVQNRVADQVEQELTTIRTLLTLGSPGTLEEQERAFRTLWNAQIVSAHPAFLARLGDRCSPLPSWQDIWRRMGDAVNRIRVMKINGSSDDALAYTRAAEGLSVIAIGGDKLSRGLTLEGLSVSYFLRTSRMFDTLMQMGRWFGYRPRYADLCRVYTTGELYGAFREIALAIDDLRADLDRMALANRTPEDFGLRVRTPSDGLVITAANKIRRGEPVQVRFAGELVQALQMPATGPAAQANREAVERLLTSLPAPERSVRGKAVQHFVWKDVAASSVLSFLTSYDAFRTHSFLNHCEQLRRYIQDRLANGELTEWTVCVISKKSTSMVDIAGLSIPLIIRSPIEGIPIPPDHFRTEAVVGSAEESSDLTEVEFKAALLATNAAEQTEGKSTIEQSKWPAREDVREARPSTRGLLLLYLIQRLPMNLSEYVVSAAISFPSSPTAQALTYTVNDVWQAEYGFQGDWDDDSQAP